jgi:pimeloyl-ACP methyl ester carboxylesterase
VSSDPASSRLPRARRRRPLPELYAKRLGDGPPVVLVHGSISGGEGAWSEQRSLAEHWTLFIVDRPGFGSTPPVERVDFEVDAPFVAMLLDDGAHLVGHSYGGVVSLLAAAQRPDAVHSLTVIEPPAFAVALDSPAVADFVERAKALWADAPDDPAVFLWHFRGLFGPRPPLESKSLSPEMVQGVRLLRVERGPWEAEIPLDALAAAKFPKLVVSGGHNAAFDAVCDVLERRLRAERAVIPGAGHSVQRTGAPFNERLEAFLTAAAAD